jgi:hypothetical protein
VPAALEVIFRVGRVLQRVDSVVEEVPTVVLAVEEVAIREAVEQAVQVTGVREAAVALSISTRQRLLSPRVGSQQVMVLYLSRI